MRDSIGYSLTRSARWLVNEGRQQIIAVIKRDHGSASRHQGSFRPAVDNLRIDYDRSRPECISVARRIIRMERSKPSYGRKASGCPIYPLSYRKRYPPVSVDAAFPVGKLPLASKNTFPLRKILFCYSENSVPHSYSDRPPLTKNTHSFPVSILDELAR